MINLLDGSTRMVRVAKSALYRRKRKRGGEERESLLSVCALECGESTVSSFGCL